MVPCMDQPIACTLTPEDHRARIEEIADLTRRTLRSREPIAGGARLTFDPGAEPEVRRIVAAEAECCAFLRMEIRRAPGALLLDITGPADAQPIVAELFA